VAPGKGPGKGTLAAESQVSLVHQARRCRGRVASLRRARFDLLAGRCRGDGARADVPGRGGVKWCHVEEGWQ
jgi:hypothetical protein